MNGKLLGFGCAILVLGGLALAAEEAGRKVTTETVDAGWVHAAPPGKGTPVVIREFSTEHTSLGKGDDPEKEKAQEIAKIMKESAPTLLQSALVSHLGEANVFGPVSAYEEGSVPEGAVVVQGEFTLLNPGSRAARYWVGMGAGKSKICVKGKALLPDGNTGVSFEHCRVGTMGWFGGKAEGMMATDVSRTGFRIADFLAEWSQGKFGKAPAPAPQAEPEKPAEAEGK